MVDGDEGAPFKGEGVVITANGSGPVGGEDPDRSFDAHSANAPVSNN